MTVLLYAPHSASVVLIGEALCRAKGRGAQGRRGTLECVNAALFLSHRYVAPRRSNKPREFVEIYRLMAELQSRIEPRL